MGQAKYLEDFRQGQNGRRFAWQAGHWLRASLVGAALIGSISAIGQVKPAFDENTAWSYLSTQLDFGPRVPGTSAHLKCRDWISDQLKKSCENVRLQELQHTWSKTDKAVTMWNVIGEQNWKDAKTRVLLIAHWDTRPTADQEFDSARRAMPIPGANDGASGVAVLLELANALKGNLPKDVGVMYLMTDGEDLGPGLDEMFLGAEYFAAHLPDDKPTYGILLDMIGDRDLNVPMEPNSQQAAGNLLLDLYRHADKVGLGKYFPMVEGPEIEDDHLSLIQAGVPTIDLIDFDYQPWHRLSDTKDKCSPSSLGHVGKLLQTWLQKEPPYVFMK